MATEVISWKNTSSLTGPEPLLVRFDRIYGLVKCYPVNDTAKVLARIARTKTLSPDDLANARLLGLGVSLAPGSEEFLERFLAGRS